VTPCLRFFYNSRASCFAFPSIFILQFKCYVFTFAVYSPNLKRETREREAQFAVPPHWANDPPNEEMDVEPLQVVEGNSIKEPTCKDNWCALEDSVKWYGPAKYGEVITTGRVFPVQID
jgi:hypothetical protein